VRGHRFKRAVANLEAHRLSQKVRARIAKAMHRLTATPLVMSPTLVMATAWLVRAAGPATGAATVAWSGGVGAIWGIGDVVRNSSARAINA
jgi:hypothetical protein